MKKSNNSEIFIIIVIEIIVMTFIIANGPW